MENLINTDINPEDLITVDEETQPLIQCFSYKQNYEEVNTFLQMVGNIDPIFDTWITGLDDEDLYYFLAEHHARRGYPLPFDYDGFIRKTGLNMASKITAKDRASYIINLINNWLNNAKFVDLVIAIHNNQIIGYILFTENRHKLNIESTFFISDKNFEIIPEKSRGRALIMIKRYLRKQYLPTLFKKGYRSIYAECFNPKGQQALVKIIGMKSLLHAYEIFYFGNINYVKRFKMVYKDLSVSTCQKVQTNK